MPNAIRRPALAAIALAACLSVYLVAGPAAAPAADPPFDPDCSGFAKLGENRADGEIAYDLGCNSDITGYTLFSRTRTVDSFDTEVTVLDRAGLPPAGQSFSCAGLLPSYGVACSGYGAAGSRFSAGVTVDADPCVGSVPGFGFFVSDAKGRVAGPFPIASRKAGGLPLTGCPKPRRANKTRSKPRRRHVKRTRSRSRARRA